MKKYMLVGIVDDGHNPRGIQILEICNTLREAALALNDLYDDANHSSRKLCDISILQVKDVTEH